jgi:putative ABC transport system substrate-binding protein
VDLQILHASTERDFDAVFANLSRLGVDGLVIAPDACGSKRLGELTVGHAVPAISSRPDFAAAGGLLSYGADDEMSPHRSTGIGESVAYLTSIE